MQIDQQSDSRKHIVAETGDNRPNRGDREAGFTPEMIEAVSVKVQRLANELDITNTDHIALWLENHIADAGDFGISYIACRIADACDAALARHRAPSGDVEQATLAIIAAHRKMVGPDGQWLLHDIAREYARAALAAMGGSDAG